MEQFRADLHIHSRYSRATSKGLTPRLLALWARVKGLEVLGTGDFTHSAWLSELEEALLPDPRSGLYVLKEQPRLEREIPWLEGLPLAGRTRFMLQGEISSIYKKHGKVRKVHNLVFMPSFEKARQFNARLAKVGNLESDGRPILGLDSRNLLEMVLETDPLAFLVPAHIWTPWFSLFGSKSGFNSIEECFGDLARHVFALETGLSSDPEMNWCISALDRFRLISNSDAHSADKLGREANRFSGEPSYEGILRALRGESLGQKFLGSIEFFPEEGKYHLDGHRDCGVVLEPRESLARGGVCPVCGKGLTLGVLHRVLELADRDSPQRPENQPGFVSLVPLSELIAEVVGTGPGTKKVQALYARLLRRCGSELHVLQDAPLEEVATVSSLLAEGLGRMRRGEVLREPGFDGQYGIIRVFSPRERREFSKGRSLQGVELATPRSAPVTPQPAAAEAPPQPLVTEEPPAVLPNPEQQHAVDAGPGPVLVVAGPGTGKTRTLILRIARLLEQGVNPRQILAVTFTRRAAEELQERLLELLGPRHGESVSLPRADTLHALAYEYWSTAYAEAPTLLSEEAAFRAFCEANPDSPQQKLRTAWKRIAKGRERMRQPEEDREFFHAYTKLKESWNLADFTDLLEFWLEQIENHIYTCPYTHVLVDEVQDFSALQLAVVKALLPPAGEPGSGGEGLFAIGDPQQSIYGFRGALSGVEEALRATWPHLERVTLAANYRSAQGILDSAAALFAESGQAPALLAHRELPAVIRLFAAPNEGSEAAWVAERIRRLLGSGSHSLTDVAATRGREIKSAADETLLYGTMSPGDVAVLVRFRLLVRPLQRALERMGLPCAVPEDEAFWTEPRVRLILQAAGAFLGIAPGTAEQELKCPDSILAKGPLAVQAYMQDMPPFDKLFWESRAFRRLVKCFEEHGSWPPCLNWVSLQAGVEQAAQRSERVRVMTLHAAKGLEFGAVFLPALEDGLLPFAGAAVLSGKTAGEPSGELPEQEFDQEEERRLLYVGLTRAKQALYLSHAAKRTLFGRELRLPPSRFLAALPVELLQRSTLKTQTKRSAQQLSLLA